MPRLWERHLLNSAAIASLVPRRSPGGRRRQRCRAARHPARAGPAGPDESTLLEPLARRVTFLTECVERLGLERVTVVRGRAEEAPIRRELGGADVVTARAVAPLDRLAGWCLPLLRPGGRLLAMKGTTAAEELAARRLAARRRGRAWSRRRAIRRRR